MTSRTPLYFLLYGGAGWIGEQMRKELLKRGHSVSVSQCRLDNTVAVTAELEELKPDRVICLVGRTHGPGFSTIDYLEQPGKLVDNVRDNLFAPVSLALLCKERGIHMTYLGTGCIFEYDEAHPMESFQPATAATAGGATTGFTEADEPNFFGSSYSVVKGFTDRLMHVLEAVGAPVLNARIRMPIVANIHPRNFITKITRYAKVCSIPNSMTVLPTLLPCLLEMAEEREVGTVNLTNPGVIAHNEILEMYREIVDPAFTWENFTVAEQDAVLASSRSNNQLDTSRLERRFPAVPGIREAIHGALLEMRFGQGHSN